MDNFIMGMIVSQVLDIKDNAEKVAPMVSTYIPGESSLDDYNNIKNITTAMLPVSYVMPPEQEFFNGSLGRVEAVLKDEGIDYSLLKSFEDKVAAAENARLQTFCQDVRACSVITDESIKSQFDLLLSRYIKDISIKPVKELATFEYPEAKVVAQKLEREAAMFMVNAKDILKERMIKLNKDYLAYLAKGDKATYADYLAMQQAIDDVVFKENAYPYNVITTVRRELIEEGVDVANAIHSRGWVVTPVSKDEKEVENKIQNFKENYQKTVNSAHVDKTHIYSVARHRRLQKGCDKYLDSLKTLTLADIARSRFANPGDIIAREALAMDSKQL